MANLTQERADKIAEYFQSNKERTLTILDLGLDVVMEKVNEETDLNVSKSEIEEYGALVRQFDMSDEALTNVTGGSGLMMEPIVNLVWNAEIAPSAAPNMKDACMQPACQAFTGIGNQPFNYLMSC